MSGAQAPLYGLVLAGGASRRMGTDKAALALHDGRTQLDWARALLARHCEAVFVSIRADQRGDPARMSLPVIVDQHTGAGPIAGIAAAQAAHPEAAWLVLACDLPFVDDGCIAALIEHRDGRPVVAFRSQHDGLPEPLCAIYEPSAQGAVQEAIASAHYCPRKLIMRAGVGLLEQPSTGALDNVNTPDDLQRARGALGSTNRGEPA
jgi:molybdopterin-guanine dinucleotide biosynthesis protein A